MNKRDLHISSGLILQRMVIDSNNPINKRILTHILMHSVLLKIKASFPVHRPLAPPVASEFSAKIQAGTSTNSTFCYLSKLHISMSWHVTYKKPGTRVQDGT